MGLWDMVVSQSSNSCNYWKLIILKKVWPKFANNTITTKLILDSEPRADYLKWGAHILFHLKMYNIS